MLLLTESRSVGAYALACYIIQNVAMVRVCIALILVCVIFVKCCDLAGNGALQAIFFIIIIFKMFGRL